MRLAVVLVAAMACGSAQHGPRFVGGTVPAACDAGEWDGCAAAVRDRQITATLGMTDAAQARAYVQRVVDRLVRVTRLPRAPRVRLEEYGDTAYVSAGFRLAVSRTLLSRLGSEAELAAVLAHELAHLEGKHAQLAFAPADDWYLARRDAEGIANERAVELLVRAGYPGDMVARLYDRSRADGRADDAEHPPAAEAAVRMRRLAGTQTTGTEGRDAFLRAVAGLVAGTDPSTGMHVGDAYVIARLGLAIPLRGGVTTSDDSTRAWLDLADRSKPDGRLSAELEVVGAAWGREIADSLEDRRVVDGAGGKLVVGIMPRSVIRDGDIRGRALDQWREEVVRWPVGSHVIVAVRPRGALVLAVPATAQASVPGVISQLRRATAAELAAGRPVRIVLATAKRSAPLSAQVKACVDPGAALQLDDPDRVVAAGDRFKCTDRKRP